MLSGSDSLMSAAGLWKRKTTPMVAALSPGMGSLQSMRRTGLPPCF